MLGSLIRILAFHLFLECGLLFEGFLSVVLHLLFDEHFRAFTTTPCLKNSVSLAVVLSAVHLGWSTALQRKQTLNYHNVLVPSILYQIPGLSYN